MKTKLISKILLSLGLAFVLVSAMPSDAWREMRQALVTPQALRM